MTKQYECLECKFECYNLSVAKKHLERTNHQVVPAGQKNIVKEVKDSREDWEPGIMVTRRVYGYEVSHWGAAIGIYDTLSEAQLGIAAWTDNADTCETCSLMETSHTHPSKALYT